MRFKTTIWLVAGMLAGLSVAGASTAQGLFDPVVIVNDSVVTEYEVIQRQEFLTVLNAPSNSREAVIEELINDRLRLETVKNAGLELTEEALLAGMEEFASRANLSVEEFLKALEESGIAEETFADFITAGVAWRDFISSRFGARLDVSEAEIDQALGSSSAASSLRVLISEIIIPAPPERLAEVEALATEISSLTSTDTFSAYAREYSATATRDEGGRLPWQAISELPPVLRPILLGLSVGEVTEPIMIPNAVALFQLRDIEEGAAPQQQYAAIEYAVYKMPGGRSEDTLKEARKLRAQVDVCNDLYGIAQDQPPEVLERESLAPGAIPSDIAFELSKLDPGEISTALTRDNGQTLLFIMMCGRTALANEEVERLDVARSLGTSRLNAFGNSYLDQIRADARIEYR